MLKKWFGKGADNATQSQEATSAEDSLAPEEPQGTGDAPQQERLQPSSEETREDKELSGWKRFTTGLTKTRKNLKTLFSFRKALDDDYLDEIESELYSADFGPETVHVLMNGEDGVRAAWKRREISEPGHVRDYLKQILRKMLTQRDNRLNQATTGPTVVLVAGVNGTGKTTSIAKLAKSFHDAGHKVVLGAADTFRAAAVEQLTIWSERIGGEIVTGKPNADPASVAYGAAAGALEQKADYLIIDTAGRLHTQKNLMQQLGKIRNVLAKQVNEAPHECLLVLDATTGQNALNQATLFGQQIDITGLVLSKLDGTAKGGIVVAINNSLDIPVKFIGLGEQVEDLEPFDADRFVDALFES